METKAKKATFSGLGKKEKKHLREMGIKTLTSFKETAESQKKNRETGCIEPCYECKFIAQKLGLPV